MPRTQSGEEQELYREPIIIEHLGYAHNGLRYHLFLEFSFV